MSKVDRFWSHEAQNIRCVRESDYDRDVNAWQERALTAEAKQVQHGEPHNCERDGHLPIGWGGPVFCELCSARLPDEPAPAKAEQPVIYPEDGPDERAALSTALFNALESYEASRGKFSRKDQKIHAKQCELIRQHAAQLLAGQPTAVNERDRDLERYRALRTLVDGGEWLAGSVTITDKSGNSTNEWAADAADLDAMLDNLLHWAAIRPARAALAPAAAVMPERMTTIPEGKTISYAAGYEDALDAVASLNRNTVPLELLDGILQYCDQLLGELNGMYQYSGSTGDDKQHQDSDYLELRAILAGAKP